jgi:hypothetical protein
VFSPNATLGNTASTAAAKISRKRRAAKIHFRPRLTAFCSCPVN